MPEPLHLTPVQQGAAVIGSLALMGLVIVLIRRRALSEDYAALWFGASLVTVIFALWQDGLRLVARALDAVTLTAPIFVLSTLFLGLVALHFAVRLSRMAAQVRILTREIALLTAERSGRQDASADAAESDQA